jgi:nucleotide-binding universal stress UspA family protein
MRTIPTVRIKKLLVPTDLSRVSLRAVDYAARLARSLQAEVTLLLVDETAFVVTASAFDSGAAAIALEDARRAMHRELEKKAAGLRKTGLKARAVFVAGAAAHSIVETAAKLPSDWIVMGTHGRTGLAHTFLGSVAERVVRNASCPVLTVPSRGPVRRAARKQKKRG